MLVWDTCTQRFAEFGSNQEIAKATREGLESDRQLCYVAFDILYVGDTSVVHQSLSERQDLLWKIVKPVKGRLEILVPNGGINDHRPPGEPCWSIIAHNMEDVERFFRQTIENRDEGIVLKDLGSKWEPSDRSGKWLKLKPDYVHASADLDVLIIGGYFGSGRHGGQVAQFLMGLAEPSGQDSHPKRFVSFCRVGTGLSDDELNSLVIKLKPFFRKNDYPRKAPRFYEVTNNLKERPDVWIESPEKSVILSITSDIRTIKSEVFAAPYSLRFPRINRIRYDKPWHECLDVLSFVTLVHQSKGSMPKETERKRATGTRKGERNIMAVPTHLIQTDVSGVKEETYIFTNLMFYFANVPSSCSLEYFHKLVAENGGKFSMNLNDSVTHCIAAEKRGIKYQAATRHGDVIHYSWILDCCNQKHLLHLQPKYFLFLTDSSKLKFQEEIDVFSDYYYWDLDLSDIKQIFSNMNGSDDLKSIYYYLKKYCPKEKWCLFQDCCMYFVEGVTVNKDYKVISDITLRRLKLEATMCGATLVSNLSHATHVVSVSAISTAENFEMIYKFCSSSQKSIIRSKALHIVRHQWVEDSLEKGRRLLEDPYSLKPTSFEGFKTEGDQREKVHVTKSDQKRKRNSPSPDKGKEKKQKGPSNRNLRKERTIMKSARPTRRRISSRRAKIEPDESESDHASEEGSRLVRVSDDNIEGEGTVKYPEAKREHASISVSETKQYSSTNATTEPKGGLISRNDEKSEVFSGFRAMDESTRNTSQKLEITLDPVQAMLLDMVPSLSQKRDETAVSTRREEMPKPEHHPLLHPRPVKKKVSYKDVAGELLKDF